MSPDPAVVLSVAPHPDDELLGGGALLLGLRNAGWRPVVLAVTLGRADQRVRRRAELVEACKRAHVELRVADPVLALSSGGGLAEDERRLVDIVLDQLEDLDPALVLAPSPHDFHHAHEATGRAVRDAIERQGRPRAVAWWGLWADAVLPNLVVDAEPVLPELADALKAHAGEVDRNDYVDLLIARSRAMATLGAERVFGFGSPALGFRHAELLTLTRFGGEDWRFQAPQSIASGEAFKLRDADPAGWWLHRESFAGELWRSTSSRPSPGPCGS